MAYEDHNTKWAEETIRGVKWKQHREAFNSLCADLERALFVLAECKTAIVRKNRTIAELEGRIAELKAEMSKDACG